MAPIARAVAAAATVGALLLSSAAAAPNGGREMSAILQAGGGGWSTGALRPRATQRHRATLCARFARGFAVLRRGIGLRKAQGSPG